MTSWPAAVLVAALLAACARGAPAGERPESGVRGVVLMGPTCPVIREGSPCPDRPFVGRVLAVGEGLRVEAETDGEGRFAMALPPGTYVVSALVEDGGPPTPIPQSVQVRPDRYTEVVLEVDTGIR